MPESNLRFREPHVTTDRSPSPRRRARPLHRQRAGCAAAPQRRTDPISRRNRQAIARPGGRSRTWSQLGSLSDQPRRLQHGLHRRTWRSCLVAPSLRSPLREARARRTAFPVGLHHNPPLRRDKTGHHDFIVSGRRAPRTQGLWPTSPRGSRRMGRCPTRSIDIRIKDPDRRI